MDKNGCCFIYMLYTIISLQYASINWTIVKHMVQVSVKLNYGLNSIAVHFVVFVQAEISVSSRSLFVTSLTKFSLDNHEYVCFYR